MSLWEGQMFESHHLSQLVHVMGRDRINSEDLCRTPATASFCTGLVWWPHWLCSVFRMEEQWTLKIVSQRSCIASSHVVVDGENIPWTVLKINLEVVCVHRQGTVTALGFVLVMISATLHLQLKCPVRYDTNGNRIISPEGRSNWCHLLSFAVLKQAVGCKFF